MKKLLCFLLVFTMLTGFFACKKVDTDNGQSAPVVSGGASADSVSEAESADSSDDTTADSSDDTTADSSVIVKEGECTPLMYKVSAENGGTLYLLGSIHAGDKRVNQMPSYVMDAFNSSDFLAVEADIVAFEKDMTAQVQALMLLLCEDGTTIEDYLGTMLYIRAKNFLQGEKLYQSAYDAYKPAMWQSLIDNAVLDRTSLKSTYGVDRFFIKKANTAGIEIREVESVDFQYQMLAGFSDKLYRIIIEDTLDSIDESVKGTEELYEAWLSGDEEKLTEMAFTDLSEVPAEELPYATEYVKAMVTDRNINMADVAEEYLAEGNTGFYVVGAAHVVGEGGIVDLLRDRGYTVEII